MKLQFFARRQAQVHLNHIRCEFFQFLDARGQGLDRNIGSRSHLPAFDAQVALRGGAAIERHAFGLFTIAECVGLCPAMVNAAGQHFSLAGATGAILAAIRNDQPLTQCRVEQGFIGFGDKLAAAGLDCDLVAHEFPYVVGYNAGVQKILIIGSGDVARRILSRLVPRARVYALLRDPAKADAWRAAGAIPVLADLDDPRSLDRLRGLADVILHLAPPPGEGLRDTRTRRLLAALSKAESLARCLIYVSTTGVYGDCAGALIDETRGLNPESARARRRVDAERSLRDWGRRTGVRVCILRAPGIYADERLPLARLENALPALVDRDDVFTNHIHADDLARACIAAISHGQPNRTYNVVDDSDLKMADYFDRVADAFGLPRSPRLPREVLARQVSPVQMSFMRESRRIGNVRLKQELKLRLDYPTVDVGIAAALTRRNACSS